ncbi:MAG TPA: hypothetical protein VET88_02365 [Gammaproteobacteria bacterium]|nr:hypothetical protein [Gammaproteobacteria bacterium]
MLETRPNFSRRVLFRLLVLGVIVLLVLVANFGLLNQIYFENQKTPVGLIVNGSILVVFLLGLAKVIAALLYYTQEEAALARFLRQLKGSAEKVLKGINPRSVIARRYGLIKGLSDDFAPINHSALAATLLADESTRTSFAKYVSNILILTGVFGTIVSLSVALVGASNLLDAAQETGDMGLVIHGMSTALSTTITAILCYLFYGYFYIKLTDAQTHFLSGVEEVTTVYLLPRHARDSETMLTEVAGLIHALREAADGLRSTQQEYSEAGTRLNAVAARLDERMRSTTDNIDDIKQVLREGFRLPAAGD